MSLVRKKKPDLPKIDPGREEAVLRCSICTGEQVLCSRDLTTGKIHELMLIRSHAELEEFCGANGLDPAAVRKIY